MSPIISPIKRCTKCQIEYPATLEFFGLDKRRKSNLNSRCRSCLSRYQSEYQQKRRLDPAYREYKQKKTREYRQNPEVRKRRREQQANYQRENPERIRESAHKYRSKPESKEYHRQYSRKHRKTESGKAKNRVDHAKRRARERAVGGTFTAQDIKTQIRNQTDRKGKLRCWWCGQIIKGKYHIDHRIPISRGGSNDARNICITHAKCNEQKHDKLPHEYNGRLL